MDAMLLEIVRQRQSGGGVHSAEKDLLQALLESAAAANNGKHTPETEGLVLDNCRVFYFAGSETTALTASWTLMLLSLHPEWQERLRAEIFAVCGDYDQQELHRRLQDMNTLSKLKMVRT